MELQYFGGNCVRIAAKKAAVVVDDNLAQLGAKSVTKAYDITLVTNTELIKGTPEAHLTIDQPGEYEVSNVSIQGVGARAHTDEESKQNATIYKLTVDDIRVAIIGHIYPELTDAQLEAIGVVDVMILPVGGSGYTLDALGALKVIKKIEPKIVIPTHYADSKLKYEIPSVELSHALKEMSMEPAETVTKLKLKHSDLPENMQLIVLERQ
jgi:L-ascorbate metabolism protein UlaG (beta-lactamase superfamily)